MGSKSRWIGRALGVVLAGIVCANSSPPARAQSKVRSFRLAAHSPLASDGLVIFAVADDGRTLLVGSSVGGSWRQVEGWSRKVTISGLAVARDALYVSSAPAGTIYRLDLGKGGSVEGAPAVFYQGAPLQRPTELALIADGALGSLLVADEGAGTVFRMPLRTGGKGITAALSGLPSSLKSLHVAADRWDLVVTCADRSEIYQPAPFENTASMQRDGIAVPATVWKTREPAARHYPTIEQPASAALAHGSLYVIDGATGAVYVTPRQQTRPVRVTPPTPTGHPTRLLALGDSLMVLDGKRGVLEPWPLPVFTEFNLGSKPRDAIQGLYAFLAKRGALPTRGVRRQGSVGDTLVQEGVGFGAPSDELVAFVCSLSPGQCNGATSRADLLVVPDLPSETAVELGTFRLQDLGEGRKLGEGLAQRISGVQANPARAAEDLWKLNYDFFETLNLKSGQMRRSLEKRQYGPYTPDTLLGLRQDDFPPGSELTVRYEKVRTLAALPRALLHEENELPRLRLLSPGFNWAPLQEVEAKAYGSALLRQPTAAPPPFDVTLVQKAHGDLMKTIHGTLPPSVVAALSLKTYVGVIEDERFGIDAGHSDFDPATFALLSPPAAVPAAGAGPVPSPTPTPAPEFRRCGVFDQECLKANHGTAVAGLIASRGLFSQAPGLAPSAVIVPLRSEDTVAGADVTKAFSDHKVRIFNLSAHYDQKLTRAIRRAITQNDKALFVVAAGNNATNGEPICESETPYPAYPVCEGYRRNVLVVAATDLAGNALIAEGPDAPGSNWNDRLVHVAAPGEGFYATGRGNSYMAVRGTSFATPLVTATAALLYAQRVLSPWSIKQRIIATADVKNNLRQKVVGAGLLNVERAVTSPWKSVLTPRSGTTKRELDLAADEIEIQWAARGGKSGGTRKLRLQDVLRLTQMPGGNADYRIVYYDDVTETLVIQENVQPGPWPFKSDQGVNGALEDYIDYVGPVVDR